MATKPPKSPLKILFADDEKSLQDLLGNELRRMGHDVKVCPDGIAAVAALRDESFDVLIVDLDMPGLGGIEVIAQARQLQPTADAVVLTGKSSTDSAIAAVKHRAFDYLTKPCKLSDLKQLLSKIAEKRELERRFHALQRQLDRVQGAPQLVGGGREMERVRALIDRVATANATVLILGETGSGKELVARALHQQSHRATEPYVAINCGALPENLIESELFGHKKGAFTGADDHRVGLFEVAQGGTIFLDEVGELPKPLQAKLLRVLESREIRRVGDNETRTVDVRVVCATHRNLRQMVEAGEFREDLMFRINTFEIPIPALRERTEDIPELANHLVRRFRGGIPEGANCFTPEAIELLKAHRWPGNVRELANAIERATILCDQLPIAPEHLPALYYSRPRLHSVGPITLQELEMQAIYAALERNDGNKPLAAEELGISLKTLYNKLATVAVTDEQRKSA